MHKQDSGQTRYWSPIKSPANQRIESRWAAYRRNRSSRWIDLFKNLIEQDIFSPGNELQQERIRLCFNKLLQDDLDAVKDYWTTHRIRHSRHDSVSGRPDELFFSSRASRWCKLLALQCVSWFGGVLARKLNLCRGEVCTTRVLWIRHGKHTVGNAKHLRGRNLAVRNSTGYCWSKWMILRSRIKHVTF